MNKDISEFNQWASEVVRFRDSESVKTVRSIDYVIKSLEDICAFANSGKGTVYYGVNDDGFVVGDQEYLRKPKKLMTAVFLHITPPLFPLVQVKKFDNRDVVCAGIIQSPDKPYFLDGKYFKRMGSTNLSLFPHEIKIFMNSPDANKYFDAQVNSSYHGGINQERFDWYISKLDYGDLYSKDTEFDENEIMQKLGLLSHNKMNAGAVLCFGTGIQDVYPQANVVCQRVDGTDENGSVTGSEKITGDLFNQHKLVERFINQNMTMTTHSGEGWDEKRQIISLLATEVMLEAIVHRNYLLEDPIALLIFNDHIEIIIPGNLSKWYSNKSKPQDNSVIPQNPLLSKLFYLSGHLPHWLPSLEDHDEILDEYHLPPMELFDHQEYTGIIIRWERVRTGTSFARTEKEDSVYAISSKEGSENIAGKNQHGSHTFNIISFCRTPRTRSEIQERIGIKDRKHFRQSILQPLLKQSLLSMTIPGKPNSPKQRYKTTPSGEQWLQNNSR